MTYARLYFSCCKHCEHPPDEISPDRHEDTCPYGCNAGEE